MQLYKSRDFGAFFQDTFTFLKENGKHYFKHFFIVNGVFLLIMAVVMYFFWNFYTELLFGGIAANDATMIDGYMNDNFGLFILFFLVFLIVALLAGLVSYAFTAIYLKLYAKNGKSFGTKDLVAGYKNNVGRLLIFLICGILIGIPIMMVLGLFSFILIITIVGMLALPLILGTFMIFYSMTLMEYIEEKRSIWDSFGYAWNLLTSKFWSASGSVALFFVMAYILQNIVVMIPYMFGMVNFLTTIENSNQVEDASASFMVIMMVVLLLSYLLGTVLNQIVQINQGIIFYSLKEDKEHINTIDVIDQIGSSE